VHLHPGVGGSLSSVLLDLQAIWSDALQRELGLGLTDLGHYRAVLVIPALYNRGLVKHLVSLLLTTIGFGGCFVVQVWHFTYHLWFPPMEASCSL